MAQPDNPLLDFAALRSRGLGLLQRLAGSSWTDHNTHDPGITVLEQLCYALTDLAYRTGYPVQDLLASAGAGQGAGAAAGEAAGRRLPGGVFSPAQVLPSGPVTLDDLRRLIIDLPGVKNVWIDTLDAPLARHDAAQALLFAVPLAGKAASLAGAASAGTTSPNLAELRPRGLYRVQIEKSGLDEDVDGGTLVRLAAQRLQQWRGLGEGIADIRVLDRLPVALDASIEIAAGAQGAEVLAAVYRAVAQYLSPELPKRSLRELLDRGWRLDQIFEGPLLTAGFIAPDDWAAGRRRSSLRLSDLIRELMAVPGVRAVKSLAFLRDGQASRDWLLPIAADRSASFDLDGSRLRLESAGLRIDHGAMRDSARRLYEARSRRSGAAPASARFSDDLAPPAGRVRPVGRYLSVQHHLPPVYGVGPVGLSQHEPLERHAQARQLKAYLLLFDQLLANQFEQLAQAGRLLSFDDDDDGAAVQFAQAVPDDGGALQFDRLRRQPLAAHTDRLQQITRDPWGDDPEAERSLALRHRQVDHLLARLGEHWGDQRPLPTVAASTAGTADTAGADGKDAQAPQPPADADASVAPPPLRLQALRDKLAYLRDYPRLSLRRGVGPDALHEPALDAEPAGLVQRLARLLGWPGGAAALPLVEHVQLRPLPGDSFQQGPLMRAVARADPFSLQLSLLLPAQDARLVDADLRLRVEQTVRQEAPAHLVVRLLWLPAAPLARCLQALAHWQPLWRQAQRLAYGLDGLDGAPAVPTDAHQVALRSARNRLIDALGLGDTFPLTDLVVADGAVDGPIKVAHGRRARISIAGAEAGVRYELRGPDGKPLLDALGQPLPPVAAEGADDRLVLESPPVTDNITYRVLATKLVLPPGLQLGLPPGLPAQSPVLLAQGASVNVGLDTGLALSLPDLPLLDNTLATVQPADARLCSHGERVRVRVHGSQEGVVYALVVDGQVLAGPKVDGNLADIDLLSPPLAEDSTLAVQATKRFSAGAGGQAEQQFLDARLRVAVRADPSPTLQPLPAGVLNFRQADAALRLSTSQASVHYRLWQRRVRDTDWRREAADLADARALHAGPNDAGGPVVMPVTTAVDCLLSDGFQPVGAAALAGTGAALDLPLGAPADDQLVLVHSAKAHDAAGVVVSTELLLAAQALLLVRPDPAPLLQLTLVQAAANGLPILRVAAGQPGVFYRFRPAQGGPALVEAAYVYQRDDRDPAFNKGLGQLALGIDFVVANDPAADLMATAASAPAAEPAARDPLARDQRPPATPLLNLPALAADALLGVRAVKAQTGVEQVLLRQVRLAAMPVWQLEPAFPAPATAAQLLVATSTVGATYQLWRRDQALADPVAGTGGPLALGLTIGLLDADTTLVLRTRIEPADGLLALQLEQAVVLRLLPRVDGTLAARRTPLAAGEATDILLANSQPGVLYQLLGAGRPVGKPVAGHGGRIEWPSGPVVADTRFTVTARRADLAGGTVTLAAEVIVALQVDLPPPPPPPLVPAADPPV